MQFNKNWNIQKISDHRYCISYTPDGGKESDFAIWHDVIDENKPESNQRLIINSTYTDENDLSRLYGESLPLAHKIMTHIQKHPKTVGEFHAVYTEKRRNRE